MWKSYVCDIQHTGNDELSLLTLSRSIHGIVWNDSVQTAKLFVNTDKDLKLRLVPREVKVLLVIPIIEQTVVGRREPDEIEYTPCRVARLLVSESRHSYSRSIHPMVVRRFRGTGFRSRIQ